jgi:hypothetical protein
VATSTHPATAPSAAGARRRPGARAAAWRWTLALAGLLIVAYPFLPTAGRIAVYHLIGLVAVGGIVAGVRLHRLPALPWLLLAAGQLSFAAGDGLWDL